MSFMKGFGSGFERAFQAGIERKERRREDTFRLMYEDYLRNRDADDERIKEDRKAVQKAKALAESVPGLPEGAWMKAYEWVQGGLGDETILENLRTGTFAPSELPAGQVEKTTPVEAQTKEALSPMQTEHLEAPESAPRPSAPVGPANPAQRSAPAPAEQPQPERKGILSGLLGKPGMFSQGGHKQGRKSREERDIDYGIKRIAQVTGLPEEEVRKTYERIPSESLVDTSGAPRFIPGEKPVEIPELDQAIFNLENAKTEQQAELAQAQVNAITKAKQIEQSLRGRADQQGNIVKLRVQKPDGSMDYVDARPNMNGGFSPINPNQVGDGQIVGVVDDQELEWAWELAKDSVDKPAMDFKQKQSSLVSLYRTGGEVAALLDKNPELALPVTSGVIQGARKWTADFLGGLGILRDASEEQRSTYLKNILDRAVKPGGVITHEDANNLSKIEQQLTNMYGDKVMDVAAAKVLYDTRVALMAYQLGVSQGQDGRALQEKERELFIKLAQGGVTPEEFKQNMGGILAGLRRDLEQQSTSLRDYNQKVELFRQHYDYVPVEVVPSMEEVMSKASQDEMTRRGIELFSNYDPVNSPVFNNRPTTQPQEQSQAQAPASQPAGKVTAVGTDPKTGAIVYRDENGNLFTE